jgi:NLPC_P60 stabilising domain, N term/SH3 domain (SH3b1 type)/NlpC/P60 family/SH3 domain of SH3b2 type
MRKRETAKRWEERPRYGILLTLLLFILVWGGVASGAVIRDLGDLSQDPLSYLDRSTADDPLLPPPEQARLNAESDLLYFAPWHRTEPRHTPEQASWGFREYAGTPGYGKGGRPHPKDWIRKMAANAHLADYPQRMFPAVTVNRVDFRILPTREPHSRYPNGPSKDNPFDNLQESSAPAGMPVLVTLVSRDRKWFLTETSHLLGWVPATDIAAVDPEFMKSWENGRYVAIVRDKAPVTGGKGVLFRAPLGAIFPTTGKDTGKTWIWTAARDARGKALLRKAAVAKEAAADMPLPLTPRHVARLARELAGEPYGWGGLYGRRDCSALTRDIFAPFGLWLPRNSGDQAVAWKFISLRNLSSAEKEALIVRQGAPWRTLLWTPGHIMLYIGVHNGKPLIFHNFWSIKTRDADGKRGKIIVGRAAVTTLQPGLELPNRDSARSGLLSGLEGMTLLGEPPENGTATQETKP